MNKGYVYIISNESMPGLLKVGYTLKDPEIRAKELYTTGVPTEYIVEYWILVDDPYRIEQRVHIYLNKFNYGKEWFKCNFEICYQSIQKACETKFYDEYIKREKNKKLSSFILNKEQEYIRMKKEQEEERRKRQEEIRKRQEEIRQLNEIRYKKELEEKEQIFKEEKEKLKREDNENLIISVLIVVGYILHISADRGEFHIGSLLLLIFVFPISWVVVIIRELLMLLIKKI